MRIYFKVWNGFKILKKKIILCMISASRNVAKSELVSTAPHPLPPIGAVCATGGRAKNCAVAAACCCCWTPDCWRNKNGCLDGNIMGGCEFIMAAAVPPWFIWASMPPTTDPVEKADDAEPLVSSPISCRPRRKLSSSSLRMVRRFFFFSQPRSSLSLRCCPAATPSS